jgi:hypothetical protein
MCSAIMLAVRRCVCVARRRRRRVGDITEHPCGVVDARLIKHRAMYSAFPPAHAYNITT